MRTLSHKHIELVRKSRYFDPHWYRSTYKDVEILGMDPAEHYVKYGWMLMRDPGPRFPARYYLETRPEAKKRGLAPLVHYLTHESGRTPSRNNILSAAQKLLQAGQPDLALEMAERDLPDDLAYTVEILWANAAIARGAEAEWLSHVNAYLAHFDLAPLRLKGGGALLDRLSTVPLPPATGGPLVSVIMPAWNAEGTVRAAANSILNQTWRNLELLIVDDASEDGTWAVLQEIAASDHRVKILRNKVNVGPYVSKNLALMGARGEWITGHDSDDWAHPQRIERHMRLAIERGSQASLSYMIRMQPDGFVGHIGAITSFSLDGVARKASVSCLFDSEFLKNQLGFWDSVRFAADTEMLVRAERMLGRGFCVFDEISMICLDHENSLTNHPECGVSKVAGISPVRAAYRDGWKKWHREKVGPGNAFMPFPLQDRRYPAPAEMLVPLEDAEANIAALEAGTLVD